MKIKYKKIAVAGLPGSGKSTVAKLISKHYGYSFHSFGNGIRQCFKDVFEPVLNRPIDKIKDRRLLQYIGKTARGQFDGYWEEGFQEQYILENNIIGLRPHEPFTTMHWWNFSTAEKLGFKTRYAGMGNVDICEDTTDLWIRYELNSAKDDEFVVIDDCRWWHEFDKLKAEGYTIVRLNVSRETAEKRLIERDGGFDPKTWDSAGETQCLEFPVDFEIDAEKDLGEVEAEVISKLFGV